MKLSKPLAVLLGVALAYGGLLAWLARPLPPSGAIGTDVLAVAAGDPAAPDARKSAAPRAGFASPDAPAVPPTARPYPVPGTVASAPEQPGTLPATRTFRDQFGAEKVVPQFAAAETSARHAARERTLAVLASEAQRDAEAFARSHDLEAEDVQRMLDGTRPFPESLIRSRSAP